MFAKPKIYAIGASVFLAACAASIPTQTTIADGVYNLEPEECLAASSVGRLVVAGNEIRYHESTCQTQSGQSFIKGEPTRMICTGEGEKWERQVTLQDTTDLLTIREGANSHPYIYYRCP